MFDTQPDISRKLRALWTLHAIGEAKPTWLQTQLRHTNEHVRVWAIQLLLDHNQSESDLAAKLELVAQSESSALVRLYLGSALQRLPVDQRKALAAALLTRGEDANDHNLPLMLWYGIEPLVSKSTDQALKLAKDSSIPLVRQFISRRLSEDLEKAPQPVNALLVLAGEKSAEFQLDVVRGMAEALRGWRKAARPPAWDSFQARIGGSSSAELREKLRELNVVFGDGRALDEIRRIALDSKSSGDSRRNALRQLIDARPPDLLPVLKELAKDRLTAGAAVSGLAAFDDPDTPRLVLNYLHFLNTEEKTAAISTLASRRAPAKALLDAVQQGRIQRSLLTAYHARQIKSLGDDSLNQQLARVWGEVRGTDEEKKRLLTRYQSLLTSERLKQADLPAGRVLFNQVCASCHKLYGEGGSIGLDLTGSGRSNLDYLLENIVDPNAVVPADFRMSIVELKDGRVLNGVIAEQTDRTLTLRTPTERLVLQPADVKEIRESTFSLMPEGLLEALDEKQTRDLIAYLMAPRQVALPASSQ
jgi:putative heme-binding domain-containing protein